MPRLALVASFLGLCFVAAAPSVAAPRDRVLSRSLPEMKFTGVTFGDAIDFIRDASGANIHVNWKALEGQNVTPDTTVNLRLRAVTLKKVLNLLLSDQSLPFFVDRHQRLGHLRPDDESPLACLKRGREVRPVPRTGDRNRPTRRPSRSAHRLRRLYQ